MPEVESRCVRCMKTITLSTGKLMKGSLEWFAVVSPSGISHIGKDYGMTSCGIDATGEDWWWRL